MKTLFLISLLLFGLSVQRQVEAQGNPKTNTSKLRPSARIDTATTKTFQSELLPVNKERIDTLGTKSNNGKSALEQIEIDRLIIDETISKAGYEFFELFNTLWTWPDASTESFIMVITERPYRGISTQVRITVNDLVVFENFLQSRYDYMEELAAIAVEQTGGYILSYAEIIKELEGADFKGTGIY